MELDKLDKDGVNWVEKCLKELGERADQCGEAAGGVAILAKKTGLSRSHLYRIFRNENVPSIEALLLIAAATDTDITWLVTGEGPPIEKQFDGEMATKVIERILSLAKSNNLEVRPEDMPKLMSSAATTYNEFYDMHVVENILLAMLRLVNDFRQE